MKFRDKVWGLEEAKRTGAFVRLGCDAEDFAININLGWIIYDSIGTWACVNIFPELNDAQISRAWLTDDLDRAQPLIDIFELSPEAAAETGYPGHRTLLFFGPMSPDAKQVRLEIQRLEPAGPGLSYFPSVIDPFSKLCDEKAVHVMAWEEPDDPMTPIPMGTIAGCWAFDVDCPRRNDAWSLAKHYRIGQEIRLGDAAMRLNLLHRGVTGWRLESRFVSERTRNCNLQKYQDMLWGLSSPDDLIAIVSSEGLLEDFAPPVVHLSLSCSTENDVPLEAEEIYGPLGPLNSKYYHLFPPEFGEGNVPDKMIIKKIVELPLAEPWLYDFDPKNINAYPTSVDMELTPLKIKLRFSIKGLFWEDDMMLVQPIVVTDPVSEANVDLGDCLVRNVETEASYFCLGQSLVEMPGPKTELNRQQVYGWQYPPVHKETRHASFEVHTVNLTPHTPIEVSIKPAECGADADDEPQEIILEEDMQEQ